MQCPKRVSECCHFLDPQAVSRYVEGPPRLVPGFAGLHRMTLLLLAECVPDNARAAIDAQLPVLSPEQDEAILRDAGFSDVSLFYAGFTFRGWVAHKRCGNGCLAVPCAGGKCLEPSEAAL